MPVVPVYDTPTIAQSGLPGPRVSAPSADAFGAQVGQGLEKLSGGLEAVYQKELQNQRTNQLLDLSSQLASAKLDTETWAKSLQGTAATSIDLQKESANRLQQAVSKIQDGISDPVVRQRFKAIANEASQAVQTTAANHFLQQTGVVAKEGYIGNLKAAQSTAALNADDPAEVQKQVAFVRDLSRGWSTKQGLAPEYAAAEERDNVTSVYSSVIEGIRAKSPYAASLYLKEHAGEMDGKVVEELQQRLAPAALHDQATQIVDKIRAAHPNDKEAQAKDILALQGEVKQPAIQVFNEEDAIATKAQHDTDEKLGGRLSTAMLTGQITSKGQLLKLLSSPDYAGISEEMRPKIIKFWDDQQDHKLSRAMQLETYREGRINWQQHQNDRNDELFVTQFAAALAANPEEMAGRDVRGMALAQGVSPGGKGAAQAYDLQVKTKNMLEKSQGLGPGVLDAEIKAVAGTMNWTPQQKDQFKASVMGDFINLYQGKTPPSAADVRSLLEKKVTEQHIEQPETLFGVFPYTSRTNQPGFMPVPEGATATPIPEAQQSDKAKSALQTIHAIGTGGDQKTLPTPKAPFNFTPTAAPSVVERRRARDGTYLEKLSDGSIRKAK